MGYGSVRRQRMGQRINGWRFVANLPRMEEFGESRFSGILFAGGGMGAGVNRLGLALLGRCGCLGEYCRDKISFGGRKTTLGWGVFWDMGVWYSSDLTLV